MNFKISREVFDYHTDFHVDRKFYKIIVATIQKFFNKNESHTEFFGGVLLGVNPIRYGNDLDGTYWLEEILGVEDAKELKSDINDLEHINKNFIVSSDSINHSYVYLCHRFHESNLGPKEKETAMTLIIMMMHARWLSGFLAARFYHPAREDIAMALYESLDNRTDLKVAGSWYALLEMRADSILDKKDGIWLDVFLTMDNDDRLVRCLNDYEDRLRKLINKLTKKLHEIKDEQARVFSKSKVTEIDGEKVLRDSNNRVDTVIRRLKKIAEDPNDFIRSEIIGYTADIVTTCNAEVLEETLYYYVDNFDSDKDYSELLEVLPAYIFNLARVGKIDMSNIPVLVGKLRAMARSSGTKQEEIVRAKEIITKIIDESSSRMRDSVKVSTRISFFMYIVLRTLTIPYFNE